MWINHIDRKWKDSGILSGKKEREIDSYFDSVAMENIIRTILIMKILVAQSLEQELMTTFVITNIKWSSDFNIL